MWEWIYEAVPTILGLLVFAVGVFVYFTVIALICCWDKVTSHTYKKPKVPPMYIRQDWQPPDEQSSWKWW